MCPYIPNGDIEERRMLDVIGVSDVGELFGSIPEDVRLKEPLKLAPGLAEHEVVRKLKALAVKNQGAGTLACFVGAGAYDGFIPAAVPHITGRSEFYTAYTPYQPEISQGTLQAIFEFQTMISELTGMEAANASMYDGATACAEAAVMATGIANHKKILVSGAAHPDSRRVIRTYAECRGFHIEELAVRDGVTDPEDLTAKIGDDTAAVLLQNPNFLGQVENLAEFESVIHGNKALMIVSVMDPLALGIMKPPGSFGADIVVGEGQSFGNALSFGGPGLGFMATTAKHMRKLPGRVVGETTDLDGRRAFVLTLQAREQHIRREKATSNICSNQALNALTATVYLSLLGSEGLKEAALSGAASARYLMQQLEAVGVPSLSKGRFFREFIADFGADRAAVLEALQKEGILGGYSLHREYPQYPNAVLVCTTEKRTREEMDRYVSVVRRVKEGSR